MSQPPYGNAPAGPPARSGGGMSMLMIVLITLAVLGLICAGICGACIYGGVSVVNAAAAEPALQLIRGNQQVTDALGTPLAAENSSMSAVGDKMTVDFDVVGPKGRGKAHGEFSNGVNGAEASVITVTLPDGQVVNVSAANDPTDLNFDADMEMEDSTE